MNKKANAVFEIAILIGALFSFAYFSPQTGSYFAGNYDEGNGVKTIREILLSSLSGGLVSAQAWTCKEGNDGSICQEYGAEICDELCTGSCFPGEAENLAECQVGTCLDAASGVCHAQTPKFACEEAGGQWSVNPPAACNVGCCVVGSQAKLLTETACNVLAGSLGVNLDGVNNVFNPGIQNEFQCAGQVESFEEGACVFPGEAGEKNNCKFGTKQQCAALGGDFYLNYLCSNPELNTICEKQAGTKCIDGKDEVYWVDSCGNRENIYDVNLLKSWNEGKILGKGESCSLQIVGGKISGNCGNCQYLAGNVCGSPSANNLAPSIGEFVCKDLGCVDEWGNKREHGEAWCAFDSQIGLDGNDGANGERAVDVPGSRHYRNVCWEGEIRNEPCQDGRGEICSEDSYQGVSYAQCVPNEWSECFAANENKKSLNKCEENPSCFLKRVSMDKFTFDFCAPKYPKGFDLSVQKSAEEAEEICSSINPYKCTYVEVKNWRGKWKCKENCDCKNNAQLFTQSMNNLCMSLGDCGAHTNLAGEVTTDGYKAKGKAPKLSLSYLESLKKYAEATEGQEAHDLNISEEELEAIFGQPGSPDWGSTWFYKSMGLSKPNTLLSNVFDIFVLTYAVIVLEIFDFIFDFGIGDTRKKTLSFSCMPWQAPTGGDDCELCGQDGLPCSAYKCQSYGQSCKLLNEGTGSEICTNVFVNDVGPPIISPDASALPEELEITEVSNLGFRIRHKDNENGCLKEMTPFNLGIGLNKPGQCKFEFSPTENYNEMENFFGGNLYNYNHTSAFAAPLLSTLGVSNIGPDAQGDANIYLRCKSGGGYSQEQEYVVNFCVSPMDDVSPPVIEAFVPKSPGLIAYEVTEEYGMNIKAITNEPSECRWSETDKDFYEMENEAICYNEASDVECTKTDSGVVCGWECNAIINVTPATIDKNIYFRCRDQPWLGTEGEEENDNDPEIGPGGGGDYFAPENPDELGNVAMQSTVYSIKKTTSALMAKITKPQTTITGSSWPVQVMLEVQTSGGVNSGAICNYEIDGKFKASFAETGGSVHKQTFTSLSKGSHAVVVTCQDSAGNKAEATMEFTIQIDDSPPAFSSIYKLGGTLHIITNEPASCEFSHNSCSFSFGEGTLMSGQSHQHTTPITSGLIHYVKCKDQFSNVGLCVPVAGI